MLGYGFSSSMRIFCSSEVKVCNTCFSRKLFGKPSIRDFLAFKSGAAAALMRSSFPSALRALLLSRNWT